MKAMSKGNILKKLKTIKPMGSFKPHKIIQPNQLSGYFGTPFQQDSKKALIKDQDMQSDGEVDDKENIKPREEDDVTQEKIEYFDSSNFRRPDLDSGTLFDPNLLAAFEQAVIEARAREAQRLAIFDEVIKDMSDQLEVKSRKDEESSNALLDFQENCPPGGTDSVIFYTTSLRGIRKTFEDCHSVRFLLESFRVLFYERDISMHSEYKEELWRVLDGKVLPPRLFIKGRYIGGADKILTLHEQGKFRPLFEGIPVDETRGHCDSCNGVRFLMCFNCCGSQKIVCEEDGEKQIRCPKCNENGVIVCPLCC
ncbi:oxidoreductase [Lithospermum erythrorhizon]|uniref:Oxidoreductase n=1 Tax=Lithospermum erythrorhizon TaxID=34254 RepID=A0AAV3RTE0_LITER